jgi:RNA polymerase sigma factor (sigma-70 family)
MMPHVGEPTIRQSKGAPVNHYQRHFNPKGNNANNNINLGHLTPDQRRFVEQTYAALVKTYSQRFTKATLYGVTAHDVANYAIKKVVANVAKFQRLTPQHAANAIAKNSYRDFWRRERAQRGHGARGTRVVLGDKPVNADEPDQGSVLDNHAGTIVDPESWVDDDHRQNVIEDVQDLMSALAFDGFYLTEIEGLDQGEAAELLGVSRTYLNKQMRKATKRIQELGISYRNWGLN